MKCFQCQSEIEVSFDRPIGRHSTCEKCGADAKVCLNCKHYDKSAHWECKESIESVVKDKDRANFCDHFQARAENSLKTSALDAANRLFGSAANPVQSSTKEDALKAAEALFKKKN